jgi:hypothetical protein
MVQVKVVTAPATTPLGALEQAVIPALPPTLQAILAARFVGATPALPVTVAVKVKVECNPPPPLPTKTTVGVTFAMVMVLVGVGLRAM